MVENKCHQGPEKASPATQTKSLLDFTIIVCLEIEKEFSKKKKKKKKEFFWLLFSFLMTQHEENRAKQDEEVNGKVKGKKRCQEMSLRMVYTGLIGLKDNWGWSWSWRWGGRWKVQHSEDDKMGRIRANGGRNGRQKGPRGPSRTWNERKMWQGLRLRFFRVRLTFLACFLSFLPGSHMDFNGLLFEAAKGGNIVEFKRLLHPDLISTGKTQIPLTEPAFTPRPWGTPWNREDSACSLNTLSMACIVMAWRLCL